MNILMLFGVCKVLCNKVEVTFRRRKYTFLVHTGELIMLVHQIFNVTLGHFILSFGKGIIMTIEKYYDYYIQKA